jgi:hypothetical protein
MSFQQCEFNFGWRPFRHPPAAPFGSFNAASSLGPEERRILPRPIKLAALKRLSVKVKPDATNTTCPSQENACTLCFDHLANVELLPCKHKWALASGHLHASLYYCPVVAGVSATPVPPSWRSVRCADTLYTRLDGW